MKVKDFWQQKLQVLKIEMEEKKFLHNAMTFHVPGLALWK